MLVETDVWYRTSGGIINCAGCLFYYQELERDDDFPGHPYMFRSCSVGDISKLLDDGATHWMLVDLAANWNIISKSGSPPDMDYYNTHSYIVIRYNREVPTISNPFYIRTHPETIFAWKIIEPPSI